MPRVCLYFHVCVYVARCVSACVCVCVCVREYTVICADGTCLTPGANPSKTFFELSPGDSGREEEEEQYERAREKERGRGEEEGSLSGSIRAVRFIMHARTHTMPLMRRTF